METAFSTLSLCEDLYAQHEDPDFTVLPTRMTVPGPKPERYVVGIPVHRE